MSTRKSIEILIVDDSELVRTGLKTLLEQRARTLSVGLRVVAEAHSVASALTATHKHKPDLVLMDVRLPDGSGFAACRQILAHHPEIKILVLTSVIDDNLIYEAMSSGAHGYLLKEINALELCQAIVDVASGKFILDPVVTARVLNLVRTGTSGPAPAQDQAKLSILSAQEHRVLAYVAEGKTNKEIATQMLLSDKTVKNYLSNVFEKLKITRRAQAAALYVGSTPPSHYRLSAL